LVLHELLNATGLKVSVPPLFHPIRSKTKANRDMLKVIFPCFAQATHITLSFDLFTVFSVLFLISQSYYFGFCFSTLA